MNGRKGWMDGRIDDSKEDRRNLAKGKLTYLVICCLRRLILAVDFCQSEALRLTSTELELASNCVWSSFKLSSNSLNANSNNSSRSTNNINTHA